MNFVKSFWHQSTCSGRSIAGKKSDTKREPADTGVNALTFSKGKVEIHLIIVRTGY